MGTTTNIDLKKEVPLAEAVEGIKPLTPGQAAVAQEVFANPLASPPREPIQAQAKLISVAAAKAAEAAAAPQEPVITFDTFQQVKLLAGTILTAERVPDTDTLIRLSVDLGEPSPRQIVAGIGLTFTADSLVGKQHVFVTNLAPRKIRGVESNGMILATGEPSKLSLIQLTDAVPNGSRLG